MPRLHVEPPSTSTAATMTTASRGRRALPVLLILGTLLLAAAVATSRDEEDRKPSEQEQEQEALSLRKPYVLGRRSASESATSGARSIFRDLLAGLNVCVSSVNVTAGSMIAPIFSRRSNIIAIVVEGEGYFEAACPNLAGETQQEESAEAAGPGCQTIRTPLSRGTVFVVPTGQQPVVVASSEGDLQIVFFEVQGSVLQRLDDAARELALLTTQTVVDEVLAAQRDSVFLQGCRRQEVAETLHSTATSGL